MPAPNALNILAGLANPALAYFAASDTAGPVPIAFTAEVQTVTISGAPTGGTFTLNWNGKTSGPVTASTSLPTTASLQTTLRAAFGMAGLTVTGTPGSSYIVTFDASYGLVPTMTASAAFTGGTTPTIAVAKTTPGVGATMATAAIPSLFVASGWCDQSGLVAHVAETANTVKGYGTTAPLRVIIQDSARSFDLNFLETNATSLAVYNRLAIGAIVPSAAGNFDIAIGAPVVQTYAAVFDVADGANHLRVYCPRLQVSTIKDRQISAGKEIAYGVTLTALPDLTGNAVYESYAVASLAA